MDRLLVVLAPFLLIGLAGCVGPSAGTESFEDSDDGFEPHEPIHIVGDAALRLATSGVRSGNGTANDPFIIAGWLIELGKPHRARTGIHIEDTSAHIQIQGCKVRRTAATVAIHVTRANHVKIRDCKIVQAPGHETPSLSLEPASSSTEAIATSPTPQTQPSPAASPSVETSPILEAEPAVVIEDSRDVALENSEVRGNPSQPQDEAGAPLVVVDRCDDVRLEDDVIRSGSDSGVHVNASTDVTVDGNRLAGNAEHGVLITNSTSVTVANNTIVANGGDGVQASGSTQTVIVSNAATDNGGYGVAFQGDQGQIVGNNAAGNGAQGGGGILADGTNLEVTHNVAHDNSNYGIVVMPNASSVQVEENRATGEDGGDRIILPDGPEGATGPNDGSVEAPGANFEPRPAPRGGSGLDDRVLIGTVGLLLLGGGGAWWFFRLRPQRGL